MLVPTRDLSFSADAKTRFCCHVYVFSSHRCSYYYNRSCTYLYIRNLIVFNENETHSLHVFVALEECISAPLHMKRFFLFNKIRQNLSNVSLLNFRITQNNNFSVSFWCKQPHSVYLIIIKWPLQCLVLLLFPGLGPYPWFRGPNT